MSVNDSFWTKLAAFGLGVLTLVTTLLVVAINPLGISLVYLALLAVILAVGLWTNVWGGGVASAVGVFAIVLTNQYSGIYPRENLIINIAAELVAFLLVGPLAGILAGTIEEMQRRADDWLERAEELTLHDETLGTLRFSWATVRLEEEIMRAVRFARPLSVAVLRMEPHPESPAPSAQERIAALQAVVRLARSVAGPPAVITHAGDDQVVLILPEHTLEQANQVAQTLAERVPQTHYFPDDDPEPLGKPLGRWGHLQVGLASLDGQGESGESLIDRARGAGRMMEGIGE
ncbi:MAG: hypothetical protein GXP41_02390 [Chloroflexi bacterium]|nr:hypothetical protein [Chloroflexota bacterium]